MYRRVDSVAGEVEAASNYYYSTVGERDEALPAKTKPRVVVLGSGPNRIGQGIEFDYCCVHAAKAFRSLGHEAVMVNCNPETVSTDYDTSDRLYFEPLTEEYVLAVCEREQPDGVVIQFGGQTPLKLAHALDDAGFRILGTPLVAIDLAEDRERFAGLLAEQGIRCPEWGIADDAAEAVAIAERIGYPVLVRPSYVLGGRAMRVCYRAEQVVEAFAAGPRGSTLVDRFLEGALEIDVDALCDGRDTYVAAVMEHVEEAGVHSGDSSCALPAPSLDAGTSDAIEELVSRLAPALGVVGLVNVQLAIVDGEISVLEANPRASRTVPFASKATGVNLVEAACRLMAGAALSDLALSGGQSLQHVCVKAAVFPFARFPGSDPVLGPEMRSTGEVMATAEDFATAFAQGRARRGQAFARVGHRLHLRARRRQAGDRPCRRRAGGPRLRGRRDSRDGARARGRGHRRRRDGEGLRGGWRRSDRRRSRPPRPLRPRREHAERVGRGPLGRLSHPRGGARRPHPVRDDGRRRRRLRPGHRPCAHRDIASAFRSGSLRRRTA